MITGSEKIKQTGTWIISFILAVLVWFIIVNDKEYTVNMEVPIQVYEPRENKTLKNKIPSTAMVRFKGKGRALLSANIFQKPILILDVANIQERYHVSLNDYYQKYPNRVIYDRGDMEFLEVVYPDTFTILIDDKITRELPVRLDYQARPAAGYLFPDKPVVEPETVRVTGPKSRLKDLDLIRTRRLNAGEISRDADFEAELINPDPDFLTLDRNTVTLSFTVETIGEKNFSAIPVQAVNVPENITIRFIPSTVSLKIIGSNERIQSITPDSIEVYFDYSKEWIPSKIYYQPRVRVPEDVMEWKDLKPSRVEVVIVRK